MQPIVKVLTPGAPDTGWDIAEVDVGRWGLIGAPGSRENPIPVQDVNAVAFLIGDPLNPQWAPGSHLVNSAQTRTNQTPGNQVANTIFNSDEATPSIVVAGWDKWELGKPMRLAARVSVGTNQTTADFDPTKAVIVDIWFARTGEPAEKPTVKVRFSDVDRLITESQQKAAGAAIVKKGNFFFSYWSYAGTYAEFVALFPPTALPEPPVPAPPPELPANPSGDTAWIQAAIGEIDAAVEEINTSTYGLAKARERLLIRLKTSLKGKL